MPVLSANQIIWTAQRAGFSTTARIRGIREDVLMTAIVLAESEGDTHAHNDVPPDDSYGLAQINMLGSLGPARRQQYNLPNNQALFNPLTNLRVARGIFNDAGGFTPWTTFTRGTYAMHLGTANTAARNPQPVDVSGAGGTGSGSVQNVGILGNPFEPLLDYIRENSVRVLLFWGGGALLLGGLGIYILTSGVSKLLPSNKAVTAAKQVARSVNK